MSQEIREWEESERIEKITKTELESLFFISPIIGSQLVNLGQQLVRYVYVLGWLRPVQEFWSCLDTQFGSTDSNDSSLSDEIRRPTTPGGIINITLHLNDFSPILLLFLLFSWRDMTGDIKSKSV